MHIHMHIHIHIHIHIHMRMRTHIHIHTCTCVEPTVVTQVWHRAAGRPHRELAVQRKPSRKARAAPRCVTEHQLSIAPPRFIAAISAL